MNVVDQHQKGGRNVRNASTEERMDAMLNYIERLVRGQLTEVNNEDFAFMTQSVRRISADLDVLRTQSAGLWLPAFTKLLSSAHSMRVERVDHSEKDFRQFTGCCDACGRCEELCGYAIDLVGDSNATTCWFSTQSKFPLEGAWYEFIESYERALEHGVSGQLHEQDMGRFFIGHTCLRKAATFFAVSTFFEELGYTASVGLRSLEQHVLDSSATLFTVNDNVVKAVIERVELLKSYVAESDVDSPMVMVDAELWKLIDACRDSLGYNSSKSVQARASVSLKLSKRTEEEDSGEDSGPANPTLGRAKRKCTLPNYSEESSEESTEESTEESSEESSGADKHRELIILLNEVHAVLLKGRQDNLSARVCAAMVSLGAVK